MARKSQVKKTLGRPKGADSAQTLARLLEAAKLTFAENGYKDASNKMIAQRAEMTSGSIYHYYPSKQELFLAVHEQLQETMLTQREDSLSDAKTFREAFKLLVDEMARINIEDPTSAGFFAVVRTEARRNPEISEALDDSRWLSLYDRMTKLGIENGEIAEANAGHVKALLALIVLGIAHHSFEAPQTAHHRALDALKLLVDAQLLDHNSEQ